MPMSYESNLKTVLHLTLPQNNTSNMVILEPTERLKVLSNYSNAVEIDSNVPPHRYYRSGLEMVRMANVYMEEGSLENAYVLYLKFMTLFIEKIREHPEYGSVPVNVKAINATKLREVLPKAEKLKRVLLQKYTLEYKKFIEEQKRKENEIKKVTPKPKPLKDTSRYDSSQLIQDRTWPQVVPGPEIGNVKYPDSISSVCIPSAPPPEPYLSEPKPPSIDTSYKGPITPSSISDKPDLKLKIPGIPDVDRSLKPSSLLSPSVQKPGNRDIVIPNKLVGMFLSIAQKNTTNNIETCGVLAGKLERDQLIITHVIISKQEGSSDTCTTCNEEEIFDYQDQHNLITLGWIHTHPSQTAFLSSIDVHTQFSYQIMMPEAIAIVCAPKYRETGIFVLTTHGLNLISECRQSGFHPHPQDPPIFLTADHTRMDNGALVKIIDLR